MLKIRERHRGRGEIRSIRKIGESRESGARNKRNFGYSKWRKFSGILR